MLSNKKIEIMKMP